MSQGQLYQNQQNPPPAHPDTAENGRPKRDRKQNIRYNSEDYDLSVVSSQVGMGKFTLYGIYVHPEAGKELIRVFEKYRLPNG